MKFQIEYFIGHFVSFIEIEALSKEEAKEKFLKQFNENKITINSIKIVEKKQFVFLKFNNEKIVCVHKFNDDVCEKCLNFKQITIKQFIVE